MYLRLALFTLLVVLSASASVHTQPVQDYAAPRTEHGHPDFQGIWATAFITMLERPPGVRTLVATPDEAAALVAGIRKSLPAVIDPDVQIHDIQQLAMVRGEYRTSLIVEPEDGRMPFTPAGGELASLIGARHAKKFDHPEERPLAERCLENLGYAPMRAVPVFLPRQIVQTRDHVVIYSEDAVGLRVIHLRGGPRADALRTVQGYSTGHWEHDTLVVETSHFPAEPQARNTIGRPLLLGRGSRITERFTRVSPTELVYRFTVDDPELYTRPWSGEFSMMRHAGPIFEYGCHEGNYSLPNALSGGRAEAARTAK